MNILGIDYGAKRVGIATSRHDIAFPHSVLANDSSLIPQIVKIVEDARLEKVVVGDTRSFDGRENAITKEGEAFMDALRTHLEVPVEPVLEVGSTVEASRYAPEGSEHNDAAAAAIILQRYIDMHAGAADSMR